MSETDETIEPAPEAEPKKKINWFAEIRGLTLMLLGVVAFHTIID